MTDFISLSIDTRKSIFNGIKLNETINIRTLELLIGSNLLKVIDKQNNKPIRYCSVDWAKMKFLRFDTINKIHMTIKTFNKKLSRKQEWMF